MTSKVVGIAQDHHPAPAAWAAIDAWLSVAKISDAREDEIPSPLVLWTALAVDQRCDGADDAVLLVDRGCFRAHRLVVEGRWKWLVVPVLAVGRLA